MARVTVEDCLDHVDNRFELVLVASKRARQLARQGMEPTVEWEKKLSKQPARKRKEGDRKCHNI